MDALSFEDRVKLEASKSIREDYLHQNAFHDIDTYASMEKQYLLMKLIMTYFNESKEAVKKGAAFNRLANLPVRETIGRFKYVEEKDIQTAYENTVQELRKEVQDLINEGGEDE